MQLHQVVTPMPDPAFDAGEYFRAFRQQYEDAEAQRIADRNARQRKIRSDWRVRFHKKRSRPKIDQSL